MSSEPRSKKPVSQRLVEPGQFLSRNFLWVLARYRPVGSMGRIASCEDNAPMGNFSSLTQEDFFDRCSQTSREKLRPAIVTWGKRIYHRSRLQPALGRFTQLKCETIMNTPPAVAE